MRGRWIGAVSAAVVVLFGIVGGSGIAARSASSGSTLSGQAKLPGPGHGIVYAFEVKASVHTGEVGSLRIRTTNDSKLPAGIRAVAAITPASSKQRSATFTFDIAINNLTPASTKVIAAQEVVLDFQVYGLAEGIIYKDRTIHLTRLDCEQLRNEGNAIETGFKNGSIYLTRLRKKAEQTSPNEEVWDFSAANQAGHLINCKGVEAPDAGND